MPLNSLRIRPEDLSIYISYSYIIDICSFYLANLTGHTEKVGMENFELLKVLGTGGETWDGEVQILRVLGTGGETGWFRWAPGCTGLSEKVLGWLINVIE